MNVAAAGLLEKQQLLQTGAEALVSYSGPGIFSSVISKIRAPGSEFFVLMGK
jgi:hypothetical protein